MEDNGMYELRAKLFAEAEGAGAPYYTKFAYLKEHEGAMAVKACETDLQREKAWQASRLTRDDFTRFLIGVSPNKWEEYFARLDADYQSALAEDEANGIRVVIGEHGLHRRIDMKAIAAFKPATPEEAATPEAEEARKKPDSILAQPDFTVISPVRAYT